MTSSTLTKAQVKKSVPKDTYPLVALAMDQGFVAQKGTKHIKLKSQDGNELVTVSKTPSDYRDIRNLQSDLIKAGVDLSTTKRAAKKKAAIKKAAVKRKAAVRKTAALPKAADTTTDKPIHTDADEVFAASEVIQLIIEGYSLDETFKPPEVHQALLDSPFKVTTTSMANVRAKIKSLMNEGIIKRTGRGIYQRVETEPTPAPKAPKEQEPTDNEVLDALKEIPLKIPVEAESNPVLKTMERIDVLFNDLRDEMKAIDTLDSKVWYEFFVLMSARERLMKNLAAIERGDDPNEF